MLDILILQKWQKEVDKFYSDAILYITIKERI